MPHDTALVPLEPTRAALPPRWLRWLLFGLGWICVALGVLGLLLPLMPGVVFFLLAAACFARSSPRFEAWLLNHRILGPPIVSWRRTGSIPRGAKVLACLSMAASWGLLWLTGAPGFVKIGMAVVFVAVASYIATRPEAGDA
jgi:uncharacterized membrane protein YbaN (DUF454 family)